MQLDQHPDILFRIFLNERLHGLVFRSTNEGFWMRILRQYYPDISVQWNYKHADKQYVLSLFGDLIELQRFCDEFLQNLHVDDGEVEALNARITELQLDNTRLRQQIQEQ